MSVQVENVEKNMAKLTVTVPADRFSKAVERSYQSKKSRIQMPGFRRGKATRAMIEKMYGSEIFYEDAANEVLDEAYPQAIEESGLDVVSRPDIEVTQIENGKDFIFTIEIAVKPDVTLGTYKGVTVTKVDTSVSEEELDTELENTRNMQARTVEVTDRAIEDGDTAVIDFEGFVDGEPFEGGKGENHSLVIGSHSFIDTFEEQLIGKNVGEELEVNVTFPEQYHAQELAGKPAVFQVKIQGIRSRELPELDDEFASLVSEFETLAEYRDDVKKNLEERKAEQAKRAKEDEAVRKIVESSTMEIPDAMVDAQCDNIIRDFANRLQQQGMTMEQYMQFSGLTAEKFKEQVRPEALTRIENSLVLEQIAKEENLEVSDEELNAEIERMAGSYGMEAEKFKDYMTGNDEENIRKDLQVQKALELVMEHATETEAAEETEAQ